MPFMKGRSPVRYTLRYLESGKLVLKDSVRIMTINYNTGHKPSKGAYDFVFWHWPQLQYKNPEVQFLVFRNITPTPFMKVYMDNGKSLLSQLDCQPKDTIYEHVKQVFCKSDTVLQEEALARKKMSNPANFGQGCSRECMCEIPGQVPCTLWVTPPKEQRGKHYLFKKDVEEEA
ncbi:small ribosomal subunit protein mS25-like [Babylonia areolata]|uniref:small ribosomal subunit protein mS25-like n=1 Tax=Babylonia areolata TaxID=304850 RepID=UPI003FD2D5AF